MRPYTTDGRHLLGVCQVQCKPAPRQASRRPVLVDPPMMKRLCGHADEERIRQRIRPTRRKAPIPNCSNGTVFMIRGEVRGHKITAIAWKDISATVTDGPVRYGSAGVINKHAFSSDSTFIGALGQLEPQTPSAAGLLLTAALLVRTKNPALVVSRVQANRLRRRWPETRTVVEPEAMGVETLADGRFHMLGFSPTEQTERGVSCHHLSTWTAELDSRGVRIRRKARHASGRRLGRPCGRPFPQP